MYKTATGFAYYKYMILIGDTWKTIDLSQPFAAQIKGMSAYVLYDRPGNIVKRSSLQPMN